MSMVPEMAYEDLNLLPALDAQLGAGSVAGGGVSHGHAALAGARYYYCINIAQPRLGI